MGPKSEVKAEKGIHLAVLSSSMGIELKGSAGILPAPRWTSTHPADVAAKSVLYARSTTATTSQLNRQRRLF